MKRDNFELSRYADVIKKVGFQKLTIAAVVSSKRTLGKVHKDISIIKDCFRYGYADAALKYGISRQRAHQICKAYAELAESMVHKKDEVFET